MKRSCLYAVGIVIDIEEKKRKGDVHVERTVLKDVVQVLSRNGDKNNDRKVSNLKV